MALRVVGAGLGRTGTHSLKVALTRLLGAPCYHMVEVFEHPEHAPVWTAAFHGELPDWDTLLAGYAAAVDWPSAAFWPELMAAYPDSIVLLSVRSPESWYASASSTIFKAMQRPGPTEELRKMFDAMMGFRFSAPLDDREACMAAFEQHNAWVRNTVPPERLLEWTATDGWGPICAKLGLPVPAEPFPLTNTREDWAARERAARPDGAAPAAP